MMMTSNRVAVAIFVLLTACTITSAFSEDISGELVVLKPAQINVNGVAVNADRWVQITTSQQAGIIIEKLLFITNLDRLQDKISNTIHTIEDQRDNCTDYAYKNDNIAIRNEKFDAIYGKLELSVDGYVTSWKCSYNPVPSSKVEWQSKYVGFGIKTTIPTVTTSQAPQIKTAISQEFKYDVGMSMTTTDNKLGMMVGNEGTATIDNNSSIVDNRQTLSTLLQVFGPTTEENNIPLQLSKYKTIIESASFISSPGKLSREVIVTVSVPTGKIDEIRYILKNN